ncbi:19549_t:CDS:2 [Funneliformis geosporum]
MFKGVSSFASLSTNGIISTSNTLELRHPNYWSRNHDTWNVNNWDICLKQIYDDNNTHPAYMAAIRMQRELIVSSNNVVTNFEKGGAGVLHD